MSQGTVEATKEGRTYEGAVRILVPKNDNIAPSLKAMLGSSLYETLSGMGRTLRQSFSYDGKQIMLQIARGEDIARKILRDGSPMAIGISGSDFVIEAAISGEFGHYHTVRIGNSSRDIWQISQRNGQPYVDMSTVFGGLESAFEHRGAVILESDDRVVQIRPLGAFENTPKLCIIGPNDTTYEEVIAKITKEKRKLRTVSEWRYRHSAKNIFESDSDPKPNESSTPNPRPKFEFSSATVTGATEGYIRHGGEPESQDLADVGVEIGATFKTATDNKLKVFEIIMPTFPVQVVCVERGEDILKLEDLVAI
jgi:ATP phosphoribosyltransferase